MTRWGWFRTDKTGSGVVWIPGELEDSYTRVSLFGGRWILASAVPVGEYHRVLAGAAGT